ncbi:TspO/MBR family protein [Phycicoccus flavus]|uniref:Tryptophan-rich sensory protein n=1 Tax=Phycicoccus flavus TaxID=2502783 RepID=A0A8T6R6V7_9MICO|nr:TspO/MBR family protein [Phycicoccus flavus]NHA69293.1 tryptophan-rich sensory protein [Phycicoccus flavus]
MNRALRAVLAIAPPVAAAAIGGLSARDAPESYGRLDTPPWSPPASAFGPAWTVLYALNGVVGWRTAGREDRTALTLHLGQLALNAAWTPLFFAAERRRAALGVVLALDAAIVAEMVVLAREDETAAALLAPYLAWCGYATALNASIVHRNPD